MKRVLVVARTYHTADLFVQKLNGHRARDRMEVETCSGENLDRLRQIGQGATVLVVTPWLDSRFNEVEEILRQRRAQWSEVELDACYVLGELL